MSTYDVVLDTPGIRRHFRIENVDEVIVNSHTVVFMVEGYRASEPGLIVGANALVSMQRVAPGLEVSLRENTPVANTGV